MIGELKFFLGLAERSQTRESFGDVDFLLGEILAATSFDGVILWLPWREDDPSGGAKSVERKVYAAGSLFRDKPEDRVFYALSDASLTANGIRNQEVWWESFTDRVAADQGDESERTIIEHFQIRSVAGIPFSAGKIGEKSWRTSIVGSLNFYRCGSNPALIKDSDLQSLGAYTRLFAHCFNSMVDSVGVRFIERVKAVLTKENTNLARGESLRGETTKRVAAELERLVAAIVPCREVCLHFLSEEVGRESIFAPAGIWPWPSRQQVKEFEKGEAITGGCFLEGETLIVGDAIKLTDDGGAYQCMPPFRRADAEIAGIEKDVNQSFAPISVIAIPLLDRQRAIGVLRCAAKSKSPYFFGPHEVFFLEQACGLIADWYGRQLAQFRKQKARKGTMAIVGAVSKFGAEVEKLAVAYGNEVPDLRINELMDTWLTALPPLTSVCVRTALAEGQDGTIFRRSFSRPRAEQGKKVQVVPIDFSWSRYEREIASYFDSFGLNNPWPAGPWQEELGGGNSLVFALYGKPDEVRGVVEIIPAKDNRLSEQDRQLCYLFSKMASFASVLNSHVQGERKAKREQRLAKEAEEKSFKLLAHQVKTPLSVALTAIERVSERTKWKVIDAEKIRDSALDGRLALMRALRVAQRMRVFSDIATDGKIGKIEIQRVPIGLLLGRLEEMAQDHERESGSKRQMTIQVTRVKDKENGAEPSVMADLDLLEQAAEILLENAVKYGDERSRIEIAVGLGNHGRHLSISVRNSGRTTPLRGDEVKRAMEFGVRLDRAVSTKRQGWGAGLYLAKHIMKAHRGDLLIAPTSERDKVTAFTLSIPTGLSS